MRIRTIKPEFWQSESNGRLSRDARLLFSGLITMADNEGRLRGSPAFIASQVFPFDSDGRKVVDRCLEELATAGKVLRYVVDGDSFVWLPKFTEHQKTDPRYPSKLPAPPPAHQSPPNAHQFPPNAAECTPLEQGTGNREVEHGMGTGNMDAPDKPAALMPVAIDLAHAWNTDTSPPLPRVTLPLSKGRDKAGKEALARRSLPVWRQVFQRIEASAFCRGDSDSKWVADFDWAIRPDGKKPEPASKVLEGSYDRRATGPPRGRVMTGLEGSGPLTATEGAL
jgi:hypothetical protein